MESRPKARMSEELLIDREHDNFGNYLKELHLTVEDLKKKILDVGSNYGDFAIEARARGFNEIYSVDIEHPADSMELDAAERPGAGKMVVADVMQLPFGNDTFDLVISKASMPHILAFDKAEESVLDAESFRERVRKGIMEMVRVSKAESGEVRLATMKREASLMPYQRPKEIQKVLKELQDAGSVTVKVEGGALWSRDSLIRIRKNRA